jgi:hypothetical protein
LQIKRKIVSCHTADSKPVKQEVNGTIILPPFSIPWYRPLKKGEYHQKNEILLDELVEEHGALPDDPGDNGIKHFSLVSDAQTR